MKAHATLFIVWFLAGIGAVAGSILGGAAGKPGLFAGAVIGGCAAAVVGVVVAARLGWIATGERRFAGIGAVIGFLIAAPVAASNLHTPITPVLVCSLAGVGALVGAGISRRK